MRVFRLLVVAGVWVGSTLAQGQGHSNLCVGRYSLSANGHPFVVTVDYSGTQEIRGTMVHRDGNRYSIWGTCYRRVLVFHRDIENGHRQTFEGWFTDRSGGNNLQGVLTDTNYGPDREFTWTATRR